MEILLLEDDLALSRGLCLKLGKEGFSVSHAAGIGQAKAMLGKDFDLAVLDLNLPDGSGLSLCGELRRLYPKIYILILTAMDTETDLVTGYELGADDYVTKPFSLSVLLSKIHAINRRLGQGSASVDPNLLTASIGGREYSLTRNESRLLTVLTRNAGQTLTKEQLLQALWDIDGDFVDENTLAVNVQRLRAKIERDPKRPRHIITVRGVGYRFAPNE